MSISSRRRTQLVLWDIDHTLIASDDMSHRVLSTAYCLLSGATNHDDFQSRGRTDLQIIEDLYRHECGPAAVVPTDREIISALEIAMTSMLPEFLARASVLPGVVEVLESLTASGRVVQGVVSGNVEANARRKLGVFSLDRWFDWRASSFGSDARRREDLVVLASTRARAQHLDGSCAALPVTFIGDTVEDVLAARRARARSIGTATGVDTPADLHRAGCEHVFPDLSDVSSVLKVILGIGGVEPVQRATQA
jgi:phosphoglycolate phosphatase